ncbi:hypothetical protein SISSUDRAFT_68862 [Sistotremastrum suecicum HHB10207 ss-3]|uniref:Uncharacterized protein n=1 Tax=Sistotremastrum suecicum HHB10207 ss-3 TaxID=1314776 RepID=A0A166BIC6_9AGAM|nr:hypothetical protein SISSUDRAFT_68862 [Sistotremastrum suecicum HHB10207 ss-3]
MTLSCSFTATAPAPGTLYDQNIPDTTGENSMPQWVQDLQPASGPRPAGAGDYFDWDNYGAGLVVNGDAVGLIDETSYHVQLLELEGTSTLLNGAPVALRVWTGKTTGWKCARMDTNSLTYSQPGNHPTLLVVDKHSAAYPTRREEIFGIYQLVHNDKYVIGDDVQNAKNRAAPCLIETQPNEIMLGIDKVILVPTAYARAVDPYYIDPSVTPSLLEARTYPPQSLVYGQSGFIDGVKVDTDVYTVFITGYIKYAVPTDDMVAATVPAAPNLIDNVSCRCIGSVDITSSTSPATKQVLTIASEPSPSSRVPNLFYSIFEGAGNGAIPTDVTWKPLLDNS